MRRPPSLAESVAPTGLEEMHEVVRRVRVPRRRRLVQLNAQAGSARNLEAAVHDPWRPARDLVGERYDGLVEDLLDPEVWHPGGQVRVHSCADRPTRVVDGDAGAVRG